MVGISVVTSPIRLIAEYLPLYTEISNNWESLTADDSESFVPGLGAFILTEVTVNALIFLASVYLIYVFFSKSFRFPTTYVAIVVASIFATLGDAWLASRFFSEPMWDGATRAEVGRLIGWNRR